MRPSPAPRDCVCLWHRAWAGGIVPCRFMVSRPLQVRKLVRGYWLRQRYQLRLIGLSHFDWHRGVPYVPGPAALTELPGPVPDFSHLPIPYSMRLTRQRVADRPIIVEARTLVAYILPISWYSEVNRSRGIAATCQ